VATREKSHEKTAELNINSPNQRVKIGHDGEMGVRKRVLGPPYRKLMVRTEIWGQERNLETEEETHVSGRGATKGL